MLVLVWNIITYSLSEDYRFFLKKIKYREDVVYENEPSNIISPSLLWSDESNIDEMKDEMLWRVNVTSSDEGFTFIDIISGNKKKTNSEEVIPELTWSQEQFLEIFENYALQELQTHSSLFDITTEYPDLYYEFYSEELSVYVFSTKTYGEVRNIFEVLRYELPYTINEVDNFWQASFYINLENAYRDDEVRMIIKHKNKAFWLKIKKDSYNAIKTLLEENL